MIKMIKKAEPDTRHHRETRIVLELIILADTRYKPIVIVGSRETFISYTCSHVLLVLLTLLTVSLTLSAVTLAQLRVSVLKPPECDLHCPASVSPLYSDTVISAVVPALSTIWYTAVLDILTCHQWVPVAMSVVLRVAQSPSIALLAL